MSKSKYNYKINVFCLIYLHLIELVYILQPVTKDPFLSTLVSFKECFALNTKMNLIR